MAATTLTDRAVVRLSGEDVRDFLQGLVTSDVAGALPVWAGLLTPQGKCLFDFIVWGDGEDLLLDCEADGGRRPGQAPRRLPPAPADPHRTRPLACRPLVARRERQASPTRVCRTSAAAGWRRLASPPSRLARASPAPRRLRRPCRARRHPLAGMQRGRAERRQLHQGLLRRPGEHRADELAAKVNRRLVVVEGDEPGPRTRVAYPELGLRWSIARVDALAGNAIVPDWLKAALAQPSTA